MPSVVLTGGILCPGANKPPAKAGGKCLHYSAFMFSSSSNAFSVSSNAT